MARVTLQANKGIWTQAEVNELFRRLNPPLWAPERKGIWTQQEVVEVLKAQRHQVFAAVLVDKQFEIGRGG